MSAKVFFDTNVLVYAYNDNEPAKKATAKALFQEHARQGNLVISTQVLQELYVTLTRVGKQKLSQEQAEIVVNHLSDLSLIQVDKNTIAAAMKRHQSKVFSFWDSLIVEAALTAGCEQLFSEDMQNGLKIGSLTISNPFAETVGK
uniref:Programmed cell death toxin MazF like n=1 Tax=uncultured Thiotrichaceae bacterium TaxID=298394 RepID=A0A6S6SFP7_9GAMM|nr:MAG: Programmed cell death toxin MazF like [uncultured Thiotrichaceae bacterium]